LSGLIAAELRDDALYDLTCSVGHRNVRAITNEKYEILFDMAAMAYLDGYGRESVATFAAALERFYEWGIRLLTLGTGVNVELVDTAWKRVKNQSRAAVRSFPVPVPGCA
jgi:hypothetical protein